MKTSSLSTVSSVLASFVLLFATVTVRAQDDFQADVVPGKFIVVLKSQDGMVQSDSDHKFWASSVMSAENGTMDKDFNFGGFRAYSFSGSQDLADELAASDDVDFVQPEVVYTITAENDSPTAGLRRINSRTITGEETAYKFPNAGGEGVDAYVVDSGVKIDHPEFEGRAEFGASFVEDGQEIDENGHGTHVAGTIASRDYGVAPKANIIAVRVLNRQGRGATSLIINGLGFILENFQTRKRPSVVNMSLGGGRDPAMERAVNALVQAGIVVVVSAGNDGADACGVSPARTPNAITVGSMNPIDDEISSFSNYGDCVDINAPGENVLSTWNTVSRKTGNLTNSISGTSMASPHVAGAVALMLSQNPSLTPEQVVATLTRSATRGVLESENEIPNLLLYVPGEAGYTQYISQAGGNSNFPSDDTNPFSGNSSILLDGLFKDSVASNANTRISYSFSVFAVIIISIHVFSRAL